MAMARTKLLRQRAGMIEASIGSYRAAENPRSNAPRYWGGSGDVHADHRTRRIIREMTRHLERNSHTWGILHDRWLDDLGTPDPRFSSKDEVWAAKTHERWQSKRAKQVGGWDSRQLVNFDGWFRLFAGSVARDGDAAVAKIDDGTWSLIESERIDGPTGGNQYTTTKTGLTLNRAGAITKVWICPIVGGFAQLSQSKDYSIDQVEFCAHRKRQSQTRGMPPLVAGIDDFERGDSLLESTVIQAEQASGIYGVIKKIKAELARAAGGQAIAPITNTGVASPIDAGASNQDQVPDYVSAARGALMMLYEDQEFSQVKNENPNLNVPPFMQFLLRLHALGLSYPYELAFMDMNGNSWSNGKMLITLARNGMNRWRAQTFEPTLTNLTLWQVKRWADEFDGGVLPEDWDRIVWSWPEIPWPDPHKEEMTNKLARENRTTSSRRIDPDWRRIQTEIAEEDAAFDALQVARIERAQVLCNEANKRTPGLDLRWPHIVSLVGASSAPGAYLQGSALETEADDGGKSGDKPADKPPTDPPKK